MVPKPTWVSQFHNWKSSLHKHFTDYWIGRCFALRLTAAPLGSVIGVRRCARAVRVGGDSCSLILQHCWPNAITDHITIQFVLMYINVFNCSYYNYRSRPKLKLLDIGFTWVVNRRLQLNTINSYVGRSKGQLF